MQRWVGILLVAGLGVLVVGLFVNGLYRLNYSADRATCLYNLKRIGDAVLAYHETHGHFPTGTVPLAGVPPGKRLSWYALINPFFTGEKQFCGDLTLQWETPENRLPGSRPIPELLCPSQQAALAPLGQTSYAGMAGIGIDAAALPADSARAGFFGYDRKITRRDLRDGAATTFMALETYWTSPWIVGGPGTVRGYDPDEMPYIGPNQPFGSKHSAGFNRPVPLANTVFADGSARPITADIDPKAFQALSTIGKGDKVGMDDY